MRSVPLPFLSKITLLWTRAREPGPVSPVKVDSPLPFPWTQRGEIYTIHSILSQQRKKPRFFKCFDGFKVDYQLFFVHIDNICIFSIFHLPFSFGDFSFFIDSGG